MYTPVKRQNMYMLCHDAIHSLDIEHIQQQKYVHSGHFDLYSPTEDKQKY